VGGGKGEGGMKVGGVENEDGYRGGRGGEYGRVAIERRQWEWGDDESGCSGAERGWIE